MLYSLNIGFYSATVGTGLRFVRLSTNRVRRLFIPLVTFLLAEWRVLVGGGVRAWQSQRRLHQLCAEYAFKRMQARLFVGEENIIGEAHALREKIHELVKG